jgi:pimeloyl-ACP methyl ester carboxylesterase
MPFFNKALPSCPKLHYYDSEARDLIPIVALTANPGDVQDYEAIQATLEKDYRFIGVNWPGYGESSIEGVADISDGSLYFYRVLIELLEALALPPAIFIGNSVGGFAAGKLAFEHPEKVLKMILVSPGGFSPKNFLTKGFCKFMSTRFAPSPRTFAGFYLGHQKVQSVKNMLARAKSSSQSGVLGIKMNRAVWASFNDPRYYLANDMAKVSTPTMIVFGKRDPVITVSRDAPEARKAFGDNATIVEMDSGHCPFAEIPEEFLKVILPSLQN